MHNEQQISRVKIVRYAKKKKTLFFHNFCSFVFETYPFGSHDNDALLSEKSERDGVSMRCRYDLHG